MKFKVTYLPLEYEGEAETIELNYNTIWADNVEYRIPIYSYINVRAKNYDKALEKAKIKLSKIAKKKKISKYIINNISNVNKGGTLAIIGAICNEQNTKIDWK